MNPDLPPSVEQQLESIRNRHGLPPVRAETRRLLASHGVDYALRLLAKISDAGTVRTLDGYIWKLGGEAGRGGRLSPIGRGADRVVEQCNAPKRMSDVVLALSKLDFRKAFMILSYSGRRRIEDVLSVEYIREVGNLPMVTFEKQVWEGIGRECIDPADRRKESDWDDQKTHIYRCFIDEDGEVTFKGPFLQKPKTLLQRILGDDMVLDVRFGEIGNKASRSSYLRVLRDGITVGWLRYRFFVYKDGGKEEKRKSPSSSPVKCYFVCNESYISQKKECSLSILNKPIREVRLLFMHIHTVSLSKYNPRFSLILSKTMSLEVDLATVNFEIIEDIDCLDLDGKVVLNEDGERLIHTDGTGYISEDLALMCPNNIYKGQYVGLQSLKEKVERKGFEEEISELRRFNLLFGQPPLLIQFRMFHDGHAVKGTVLLNKKLPSRTIQVRRSMVKVFKDSNISVQQAVSSFEIVGTSNHPKHAHLSRYIIAHLSYGGVPQQYFTNLVENALCLSQNCCFNKRTALQVALRRGDMDKHLVLRMILSGIPIDEPFLQGRLSVYVNEERKGLLSGKIPIRDCYYLMGTADPTGKLKPNEVCIILENGQISGKVLVYKHPGLHFGDIHVLEATYIPEIGDIVGSSKYAIFFPITGSRSLADEIANSDFDGDMYWVSTNPQLIDTFRSSEPWIRPPTKRKVQQPKASELSEEDLEFNLYSGFLKNRFERCNVIGAAADSWLVYMDRVLTLGSECTDEKKCIKEKMLQLVNIYYDALDAEKLGIEVHLPSELKPEKYPHFMERENQYKSTSILGLIYDMVKMFEAEDVSKDIWFLPPFNTEVPEACLKMWQQRYKQYRMDMQAALATGDKDARSTAADQIIQVYKKMLYEAVEFEQSMRAEQEIFNEALAIYQVTYNYAKLVGEVSRCNFAWKVAGRALCKIHAMAKGEEGLYCSPSVLLELFS